MFRLHEAAEENFNGRAETLLESLREVELGSPEKERFSPDLHVVRTIGEDDIKEMLSCRVVQGMSQKLLRIELFVGGKRFRLDDCAGFEALCTEVASRGELRRHIGRAAVEEQFLAWLRQAIAHGVKSRFVEFLLVWLEDNIKDAEVWVPIANLHIESELAFGEVAFRPVASTLIDDWVSALPNEMTKEERAGWEERIRKRTQGHAAAVCHVKTEPESAVAVATMLAEEAVTLLRVASGHVMFPRAKATLHLRGREHVESSEAWIIEPGSAPRMTARSLRPFPEPFKLSDEAVGVLRRQLDPLALLFAADPKTPFQQQLVRALTFYSESALTREPGEKLLRIMTAIEIVLLKDESEFIQQSIAERMALVLSQDVDERLRIVALVKKCYAMRSVFIHHGRSPSDLARLETFMNYAFRFFLQVVWGHEDFATKDDLLSLLDRAKYSGTLGPHREDGGGEQSANGPQRGSSSST